MKKILLSVILMVFAGSAFAQSDFNKSMAEKIAKLQTTEQADDLGAIANEFDRLIEKNDSWLTYYYTAYAYIKKGRAMLNANKLMEVDDIATVAEKYAMAAYEKNPASAEPLILLKKIHSLRAMVDPASRYESETVAGNNILEKAATLDPQNPRITLAKAEDLYFTPKEFGGSKEKGLKMYQSALDQLKTYKPATSLDPNWGKEEATYFINESRK